MDSRAEINWKMRASEPHTEISEKRKRAAVLLSVNSGALFIAPFLPLTSFLINRMPSGAVQRFQKKEKKASSKKHRKEKQSVRIILRAQIAIEALHCSLIYVLAKWKITIIISRRTSCGGSSSALHWILAYMVHHWHSILLCRRCTWNNVLKVHCRRRSSLASSHFSFFLLRCIT